jgi:hypothetical protein
MQVECWDNGITYLLLNNFDTFLYQHELYTFSKYPTRIYPTCSPYTYPNSHQQPYWYTGGTAQQEEQKYLIKQYNQLIENALRQIGMFVYMLQYTTDR